MAKTVQIRDLDHKVYDPVWNGSAALGALVAARARLDEQRDPWPRCW